MAIMRGRCKNYGGCRYADDRKVLEAEESRFLCPGCGSPLTAETPPGKGPGPSSRMRRRLLLGGALALAALASAVGWRRFCCRDQAPVGPALDAWIDGDPPAPELAGARQGFAGRATRIAALKEQGKVLGTEYGLLAPVTQAGLSPADLSLLDAENRDRRDLYDYVATHVKPAVGYERVANAFAMRRWREWPQRQPAGAGALDTRH